MDEYQELLKLLEDMVNGQETTAEQPDSKVEEVKNSDKADGTNPPVNSSEEIPADTFKKLEAYKQFGLTKFLTKNADFPNLNKIFHIIQAKADDYLVRDIKTQTVKDDYSYYLEKAKEEALREILQASKETAEYMYRTAPKNTKQKTPSYFMKDYYNDYKKMMIHATAEGVPIEFRDGMVNEKGLVQTEAVGTAPLDRRPNLDF